MKRYLKLRYILLGMMVIVFCFVPVVDMEYIVMVEKEVSEPYTALEEVQVPYTDMEDYFAGWERETYTTWDSASGSFIQEEGSAYPVIEQRPITRYRTVIKEVTKTRLVTREVAETRTKLVSILRYLLR